uniref:Uncharacterized protein n=1 Tax=Chromera velia CCMP2878 TaxID=1169474 RepID=A0A0G4GKD6_9ALVE|eukprot:Cvel_22309.t1-p1 / transcript=Cvel_22309.t1 / gene=Cvel_22309 / organism=Chromera_velia_CCMP2878 / gene_product=Ankyrin repeat and KH domain-containing protein 1, putative / transcript_product=Ankyrin repeat and KH domain-containing protein 1, putative / location=Cvel_scaffold2179:26747-31881(-) / protein_length=552 / sequence_SO=supercontig / SO=protein_coding / is_pseudo=false
MSAAHPMDGSHLHAPEHPVSANATTFQPSPVSTVSVSGIASSGILEENGGGRGTESALASDVIEGASEGAYQEAPTVTSSSPPSVVHLNPRPTVPRAKANAVQLAGAVRDGDESRVRGLLAAGANVNGPVRGETVLHIAARMEGDVGRRMVEVLMEEGAQIDAENRSGQTPLKVALLHDRATSLDAMLDTFTSFAAAKHFLEDSREDILKAMASGGISAETMKVLGDRVDPKDLSEENKNGDNVFRTAIRAGRGDLVPVLRELGVDMKNEFPDNFLCTVIRAGRSDLVPVLLELGVDKTGTPDNFLRTAIRAGRGDLVPFLLELGVDPNSKPSGDWDEVDATILRLFVERMDPNTRLQTAGEARFSSIERGTLLQAQLQTAGKMLFSSIERGKSNLIQMCLDLGADKNAFPGNLLDLSDDRGRYGERYSFLPASPLHMAVQLERLECARKLIAAGADLSTTQRRVLVRMFSGKERGDFQESLLLAAVRKGCWEMVDALLAAGARWTGADEDAFRTVKKARANFVSPLRSQASELKLIWCSEDLLNRVTRRVA